MSESSTESELQEIKATLTRLRQLVETTHLGDEAERSHLLQQLEALNGEVTSHFDGHRLPETFHGALQHTEAFAISRLSEGTGGSADDGDISWQDFSKTLGKAVETWESKHPRLASVFMDLTNVLSKLGI